MHLFLYLTYIFCSSMVRVQFAANLDLYLVLYNRSSHSHLLPMFTTSTLMQIRSAHNICAKAALRQIDYQTFEFYFCGYKMCLNRKTNELQVCIDEEANTKWELQKLDLSRTYAIRNNNFCITLKSKKVVMEPCHEGVHMDQILHVIPDKEKSKFFVSDDDGIAKRKRMFEAKVYDNEEAFKAESVEYGAEFGAGPRRWNTNMRYRMS